MPLPACVAVKVTLPAPVIVTWPLASVTLVEVVVKVTGKKEVAVAASVNAGLVSGKAGKVAKVRD